MNLTVHNYKSWCGVSINGSATFPTTDPQTVCVTPGTIALIEEPASNIFEVGLFYGTTGDTGAGDPGTCTGTGSTEKCSTSVVVGSTPKCVFVCCPFTSGSGCAGVTNPCGP